MKAQIMDGKLLRNKLLDELNKKIRGIEKTLGLAVIQIGNDEASAIYVRQKTKIAKELGIKIKDITLPSSVQQDEVIKIIQKLNNDKEINGILVQMPIPANLDKNSIQNAIDYTKDVDGLTSINMGKLVLNEEGLRPCTPKGIIDLLKFYEIELKNKNVVIIGRSSLVGKPLANMFTNMDATVTLCHSKTVNFIKYTKLADIVVVAVGKTGFLKKEMVKKGAIVIDVGINRVKGKIVGDACYDDLVSKCSFITPVPGGVGPMTVYELMNNIYLAYWLQKNGE